MQNWSREGTRLERTGWRCEAISQRHRDWGFNCPSVDLDFVMCEYNHAKPVALVEYKDRRAQTPRLQDATFRALAALADGYKDGALPFFVAIYDPVDWWFRVIPVNEPAHTHYGHVANQPITEQRFVRSLYLLRKKVLTRQDEIEIAKLSSTLPDEAA